MAETIRGYFRRRTRRALTMMLVGAAVGLLATVVFAFGHVHAGEVAAVVAVAILCTGLWHLDRTQCPHCQARLSATASSKRPRPINFCPYCGVSLDAFRPGA
jgi:hypothetical protein